MTDTPKLILASGSPRRLALLEQIGLSPDHIIAADIDEAPRKAEHPRSLARRLAEEKAERAADIAKEDPEIGKGYVLAGDTVVAVGRRILPKAELLDEATYCLRLLSGRTHKVFTGVCLITPKGKSRNLVVETRVRFKLISNHELEHYLASGEWRGKAGGYAIQGLAGAFVVRLVGSYPAVVGLPLQQVATLLAGEGYPVHDSWATGGV